MNYTSTYAHISACGQYRYGLLRQWDAPLGVLVFCMLNPSTADGDADDATVRRCVEFARRLGYGSIFIVNLFAFRTKNPLVLKQAGYPVGEENDRTIMAACMDQDVICAWGANARAMSRAAEVLSLLRMVSKSVSALELTADGIPKHPLYLRGSNTPVAI